MTAEELGVAVATLDVDGTGEITYDEFSKFWRSDARFEKLQLDEGKQAIIQQLTSLFQYFDEDYSGELSAEEFRQLHENLLGQGYALADVDATLAVVDKTGDGSIAFNEYMAWMIGMGCLDWAQ